MNDTRSMTRARRIPARIAVVLCLLLIVVVVPATAIAAPVTMADVEAAYLNSATIKLMTSGPIAKTFLQLDGGAVVEARTVTTSIYGAHVLKFWSTDTSGNIEPAVSAPFFVDDHAHPAVVSDCIASYANTATICIDATDNFTGSGIDFLCYRVDGGRIFTVMAPASVRATNVLFARIATVKPGVKITSVPAISPGTTPPANHYGTDCGACHQIIVPTPEPTTTPEPSGTPAPAGAASCKVVVTGVGSHTVEYWTQDLARNASVHTVKTFSIARVATRITLRASASSMRLGGYVSLSSVLSGGAPAGSIVRFEVRRPGTSAYSLMANRGCSSAGASSFRYRLTKRGTYYFRTRFLGTSTYASSTSSQVRVIVK
jgi:hypothetical protein